MREKKQKSPSVTILAGRGMGSPTPGQNSRQRIRKGPFILQAPPSGYGTSPLGSRWERMKRMSTCGCVTC